VEVFEGVHRLTATAASGDRSWKRTVTVKAGQTTTAVVLLSQG
jgi:hypothetical protein